MRLVPPIVLALIFAAGGAWADGPVTSAGATPASQRAPTSAIPPPLGEAQDPDDADGPDVRVGPCGPYVPTKDGKPDQSAHGVVDVGVGTSGYRHVSAVVCKPIGDKGAVTIGVSDTQVNVGRRR
ncbi:MAG: hypothetical protein ACHP7N_18370 [Caulobacterales bacterium]